MAKVVKMPVLGNSVEEVRIIEWVKQVGDAVAVGEKLAEVETDKTNIDFESPESGYIRQILAEADSYIKVEAPVLILTATPDEPLEATGSQESSGSTTGFAGENVRPEVSISPSAPPAPAPLLVGSHPVLSPRAQRVAAELGVEIALLTGRGTGPHGRVQEKDVLTLHEELQAAALVAGQMAGRAPKASPLARAVATESGLDLAAIAGTGSGGRILAADVRDDGDEKRVQTSNEKETKDVVLPASETKSLVSRSITLTGLRKRVADNLMRSVRDKPHVTLNTAADMTEATRLRNELLPVIEKATGVRVSPTDIIVKAAAVALKEHPNLNAHIEGDTLTLFTEVNIGLAVSLGEEGLIVPVIKSVQSKGLSELVRDRQELVNRARAGKLTSADITGGTFTVTNLGNYGITSFDPILPPPQVAILGVGAIADTVVARNGQPVVRSMIGLSLSFDHRAIDGAPAAAFLARLREILEQPYLMLV